MSDDRSAEDMIFGLWDCITDATKAWAVEEILAERRVPKLEKAIREQGYPDLDIHEYLTLKSIYSKVCDRLHEDEHGYS